MIITEFFVHLHAKDRPSGSGEKAGSCSQLKQKTISTIFSITEYSHRYYLTEITVILLVIQIK